MADFRKILVPVDLSRRSIGAVRYGEALGNEFDSELVFVHALQEGRLLGESQKRVRDKILSLNRGASDRFVIREGHPAAVILDTARIEQVDLILMPTRGIPTLPRLFGRSITEEVLRSSRWPVWAGLDDLSKLALRPIRKVLCGLSLGPQTTALLRWAAAIASRLEARLSVIHTSGSWETVPSCPSDPDWRLWIKKLARDDIRDLQEAAGTDAEVWLESGRPLAAIPPVAERLRADLLVIGKSPRRRRLRNLRALSYDMVVRAPCPVVSV